MRLAEEKYIQQILTTTVYNSGTYFPIHEIQRCLSRRRHTVGVSRIREVANVMISRGMLTAKMMESGETYYKAATGSAALLSKLWARPVSDQYSPRWC